MINGTVVVPKTDPALPVGVGFSVPVAGVVGVLPVGLVEVLDRPLMQRPEFCRLSVG